MPANKAYDSDALRRLLIQRDTTPMISEQDQSLDPTAGSAFDLRFAPTERQPLKRTFVGMRHAEFR